MFRFLFATSKFSVLVNPSGKSDVSENWYKTFISKFGNIALFKINFFNKMGETIKLIVPSEFVVSVSCFPP